MTEIEIGKYKFSSGLNHKFPPKLEYVDQSEIYATQMKDFKEDVYYPLIISIVK